MQMRLQSVENQVTGRSLLPLLTHSTNGLKWLASKSVTFSFSATKRVKTRCFK
ncbi:hypothetical protein F2Q68_00006581 [Brassica cretica]|uniref:Uncharacterized protein n=1 Tax=Brassica cretica TaxID=69181 RepID=A0A8S9JMH5_BRACR|nr:hypothetical protein F2Q68_00006581 [Brassica cretica]